LILIDHVDQFELPKNCSGANFTRESALDAIDDIVLVEAREREDEVDSRGLRGDGEFKIEFFSLVSSVIMMRVEGRRTERRTEMRVEEANRDES